MPNIEIRGFLPAQAYDLNRQIFDLFAGEPFVDDMVVTICSTPVLDAKGKFQPYLRVLSTPSPVIPLILGKLQNLGIDIEHLELKAFIPKK